MTPEVIDALNGLEPGDPILVLTWLHHADRDVLTTRPRGERERRLTGVFATRSPDRPNPIGIHATTIMGIRGSEVDMTHLEVVNGTPIVDLKPVLGRISQR
jgi:tRNA-Thr(GGU) m(6)t(6)A37 methyltransferase TsaA